jgi:hypothetical protein
VNWRLDAGVGIPLIADNRSLALYDPAEHRSLASRFGYQDATVSILCYRAFTHWLLGYPEAALADANHALKETRAMDLAVTLMFANAIASHTLIECGSYDAANALLDALVVICGRKRRCVPKGGGNGTEGLRIDLAYGDLRLGNRQGGGKVHAGGAAQENGR